MWSIRPTNCEDVQIRGLNIRSTGGNGNGIDVDSCRRVRIEKSDVASGNDCNGISPGPGSEAYQLLQTCKDIAVSNARSPIRFSPASESGVKLQVVFATFEWSIANLPKRKRSPSHIGTRWAEAHLSKTPLPTIWMFPELAAGS